MPADFDSASTNPAAVQPTSGPGSQTPVAPPTGATPVGVTPLVKPQGTPGAPAGAAPGGLGAPAPAINQEDSNRYKAIQQTLYPDLVNALDKILKIENASSLENLDKLSDEDISKVKNYLLDVGWDSTYLFNDVFKTTDSKKIKDFLNTVYTFQKKINDVDATQFENFVKQKELQTSQQSTQLKKQEADILKGIVQPAMPAQPPQGMAPAPAPKPMQPPVQTGAPTPPSGVPAQPKTSQIGNNKMSPNSNLRGESMADFKVEDGKIKQSSKTPESSPEILTALFAATKDAEKSISKYAEQSLMLKGAEAIQDSSKVAELKISTERLASIAKEKLANLFEKIDEASDAKKDVKDIDTDKKFDESISKGKDVASKGTDLFSKKEEKKEELKKDESNSKPKKDLPKEEDKKVAGILDIPGDAVDAVADMAGAAVEGVGDIAQDILPGEEDPGKVAAAFSDIRSKFSQLFPLKDLNKEVPSKVNAQTAKAQIKEVASTLNQVKKDKNEGLLGQNREKSNDFSAKEVEQIKKSYFERGIAKSKLAHELACMQQIKGLLANPLKEAFVKEAAKAGISESDAKAIAHNAFINAYQASQEVIATAAFDTFVKKSSVEFKEISEATKTSSFVDDDGFVKESSSQETTTKKASASSSMTDFMRQLVDSRVQNRPIV